MKVLAIVMILFSCSKSFGQSNTENEVLNLSAKIFNWEVQNKIDSLQKVFHKKFIVVSSDGSSSKKDDYLKRLQSGGFIHNNITVEENSAAVSGNTATVVGKGKFDVTISGKQVSLRLSYLEVFTRETAQKEWQVLAMKASVLEK